MLLNAPLVHVVQYSFIGLYDEVDPFIERVEVAIRSDCSKLDDLIFLFQTSHLNRNQTRMQIR